MDIGKIAANGNEGLAKISLRAADFARYHKQCIDTQSYQLSKYYQSAIIIKSSGETVCGYRIKALAGDTVHFMHLSEPGCLVGMLAKSNILF